APPPLPPAATFRPSGERAGGVPGPAEGGGRRQRRRGRGGGPAGGRPPGRGGPGQGAAAPGGRGGARARGRRPPARARRGRRAGAPEEVIYTPDGKVIGCGGDRTVRVWDPATGEQLRQMALPAKPRGLALLSADRLVVTSYQDGHPTILFNWKTGQKLKEFPSE